MAPSVGVAVTMSDETLRRAAIRAGLTGASNNQMLRYFALRVIMSADDAWNTVFGSADDIKTSGGRIYAQIPIHELERILKEFPDIGFSEIVRTGAELAAAESPLQAVKNAFMQRGPKLRTKVDTTSGVGNLACDIGNPEGAPPRALAP